MLVGDDLRSRFDLQVTAGHYSMGRAGRPICSTSNLAGVEPSRVIRTGFITWFR
jgi:hypothetical protein